MTPAIFLQRARECRELARTNRSDPESRGYWLQAARNYLRLVRRARWVQREQERAAGGLG